VTSQTLQTAGVAAVPRVNLMPPEIADAERFRRLQLAMGGAVLAAIVIVGALYDHAKGGITSAQHELDTAQTQQTTLQGKLNGLSNVSQTYSELQAKQSLLQQAMGPEIRWSYMLNDLSYRIPSNVWMSSISASETAAGADAGTTTALPGADSDTLGTVTFSGVAFTHDDVAAWLDAMAKEKGFTQPTFTNSTETGIGTRQVVDFSSQVLLDSSALSNRYVQGSGN
jgi:Tfp pilus assembly protein PilN